MSKKTMICISIPLIALLAGMFILSRPQGIYVARIDGMNITLSEYYVYLYEQKLMFESLGGGDIWETDFDGETPEDVAKQNALSSMQLVKLSVKQAKKRGISLSPLEKEEAAEYAQLVFGQMGPLTKKIQLSHSQLTVIMEENDLYRKLFDEITEGYDSDEERYEIYYAEYNQWAKDVSSTRFIAVWNKISIQDLVNHEGLISE